MATVFNQIVSVQPLSAPSGQLYFMDVKYNESKMEKKSRRSRSKSMKRFKIKYTNTKGVIKTRNIKATSEERAMNEIKDMSQHHYTIVESLDEPEPKKGLQCISIEKAIQMWNPIINSVIGNKLNEEKKEWLNRYVANHAVWESCTLQALSGNINSIELPIARRVFSKTTPQEEWNDAPSSEEKKS